VWFQSKEKHQVVPERKPGAAPHQWDAKSNPCVTDFTIASWPAQPISACAALRMPRATKWIRAGVGLSSVSAQSLNRRKKETLHQTIEHLCYVRFAVKKTSTETLHQEQHIKLSNCCGMRVK
jgi:hypothetical protein